MSNQPNQDVIEKFDNVTPLFSAHRLLREIVVGRKLLRYGEGGGFILDEKSIPDSEFTAALDKFHHEMVSHEPCRDRKGNQVMVIYFKDDSAFVMRNLTFPEIEFSWIKRASKNLIIN